MKKIRTLLYAVIWMVALGVALDAHALDTAKLPTDTTHMDKTTNSKEKVQKYIHPETLPDSITHSVDDMAHYIMDHYDTDKDRLWAAYSWICQNVKYSPSTLSMQNRYQDLELAEYTLKKKIGVCGCYATLFNELAQRMGIESYYSNGYSVSHKVSGNERHAWVICLLDGKPYVFEPTWGAGYYDDKKKKFTFHFDPFWFALPVNNEVYTSTHFPKSSFFQCSSSPKTFKERFYDVNKEDDSTNYAWKDQMNHYTQEADSLERAEFWLQDMNKYLTISFDLLNEKPLINQGMKRYYKNVVKPAINYKKQFKEDIKYQKHLIQNLKDIRTANALDKQADSLVLISNKWEYFWNKTDGSAHWSELGNDAKDIIERLDKMETNNSQYKAIIKELRYYANCYLKYPTTKGVCIRNHKAKSTKTNGKQTRTSRYTIEKDLFKEKERVDHETCSLTKIVRKKEIEFLFDTYRNGHRRHFSIKLPIMKEPY